ncbi:MAG: Universal stress protein family protein [Methanoregula sp. PtaU1.Bin051]|nr:MAG: Universal stress protein family protein [Methanoregula sp. PtaU1.Bin051]
MPVFSEILVAIDGSKASEQAFAIAIEEARLHGAKLHTVYVVETGLFSSLPADNTVEIMYRALEKEGEQVLAKARALSAEKGVSLATHMKQGHAGNEIISLAEQLKVSLIIIGSHGKGKADRLLLGSVSNYVITHGKVSAMVVRS